MSTISRREFLKGSAATVVSFVALSALDGCASNEVKEEINESSESKSTKPTGKVDGKYVTKAMGHENWIYVATTIFNGKITACEVLSHEETMGIGNYACARIPAAIVANQSVNVPNVSGASTSSRAVKEAVSAAIEAAGYDVNDFSKEIIIEQVNEHEDVDCDVVVVGAGTAGLVASLRLIEQGKKVVVLEKHDIPGGSMPMTYGGFFSPDSQLQKNFDTTGTQTYTPETYVGFFKFQVKTENDRFDGAMPYDLAAYSHAGELVDWLHGMGVGFNSLGSYEAGTTYGATPYLAPGCYKGGAGYLAMFLANRIVALGGRIEYATACNGFLKSEDGKVIGVTAKANNGKTFNVSAKKTVLACGGFARNTDLLKKYQSTYADQFFNCCSGSTGDMIPAALELGAYMECINREMPAFLSSYNSKFELAFIHYSAPGIIVNKNGNSIGNFIADNHYSMGRAKMDIETNGNTFYYIMDDASAQKCKDSEIYGFDGYKALFDKGEAIHYNSVEECMSSLELPGLAKAIEANNKAALSGEADEYGRKNCPYIETRDGVWAIHVDPTFYLTTSGLAIDTSTHLLKEDGSYIENVYAIGDVAGSAEEKDGKTYGCGFIISTTYGMIAAETIQKEWD